MIVREDQMKGLFENLQRKHPNVGSRPSVDFKLIDGKEIHSGADLRSELLRDFSDHFGIPIDCLRKCSCEQIELLMLDAFTAAKEKDFPSLLHIPFEVEQNMPNDDCR
jgi:hypothetical protein